jgi:pyruvate kinase
MRKTKIIATLGPATESPETLRALIEAGVDCFRLNMSHASHESVRALVPRIRAVARDMGKIVGVLMDTQGPAIRTGELPTKLNLKPGDIFEFTVRGEKSEEAYSVDVNYDGLVEDINVGDIVLVDNGVIHMRVLSKSGNKLRCQVLTEGVMGSRRHINLPGVKVNLPPLTEKDLADVALGAELGVDFVALSFCREPSDVDLLRRVLGEHGSTARIVAKIEDQLAVKNINGIIATADVIMVARGDLGIECPMEELPIIQRRIVKACHERGRTVIVATHMLESMITNPVPTRAEVTDVANAVFEQADAIMLSGETSTGKYPVRCVEAFDTIALRIERSGGLGYAEGAILENDREKTVRSAVVLANSLPDSTKIVIFTRRGTMASYVAGQRPRQALIFAFAPTWELCRKLVLHRAVVPIYLPFETTPERTIGSAENYLTENRLVRSGDHLVVVSDIFAGEDRFDSIQLRKVP